MSGPQRPAMPGRRAVLGGAGLLAASGLLAACGSDTSSRYGSSSNSSGSGDTGFVAGDGVTTEIPADDRADPIRFSATAYDGTKVDIAADAGSVVVLNVWYAACAPCRKEAPDLAKIFRDYESRKVRFVGVNVRDEKGPATAFEKRFDVPYPSVPDLDAKIMYALRGQVSPNAVPSTLVLDRKGRAAARISGAADPSILRAMIDKVLAE